MRQLYVIGDPVAHSLSPLIQRAMIRQTEAAYRYDVRTVRPDELADFVAWARDGGCAGCNVTMPLKEAIVPLLDEVDGAAAACGAVNTVCIRAGRAVGHNTDGDGLLDSLAGQGFDPRGARVLLLGAGGAATAVCHALTQAGAARIAVCNRSVLRAETLAARYPGCAVAGGLGDLARYAADSELVVNATCWAWPAARASMICRFCGRRRAAQWCTIWCTTRGRRRCWRRRTGWGCGRWAASTC